MNGDRLSENWAESSLANVIEFIRGVTYKKNESFDIEIEGYIPVLRANNIQSGKIIFKNLVFVPKEKVKDSQIIKTGDVIVAMSSGSKNLVGKSARATEDFYGAFGAFCGLIRPLSEIDDRYVSWFTYSREYKEKVSELSKGVNINNLKPDHFKEIYLPIAPLNEQIRIANKLDTLLAKVEAAQTRLEKIPTLLKRFRQSVLAAATSGELTAEWREDSSLKNWESVFFGDLLISSANGLAKRKGTKGEPVTVLRLADFKNARRIHGKERKIIMDEKEKEKYVLISGDLLAIRVNGSIELAGLFIEYKENSLEAYCDHFIRFRINSDRVLPVFITYITNEGEGRKYLKNSLSTSAGQNTINQTSIKGLRIAFPPLAEQKEIVRRVEALFALADSVEKQYQQAFSRLKPLLQSILAKGFRGELVPQDPNDEPAEQLLARIQAQREKQKPAKKSPKSKKTR